MWADIKWVYRGAWQAAFALPILFLIPGVVEFIQHVVEIKLGMYASLKASQVVGASAKVALAGMLKLAAGTLPTYWFVRYLAWGDTRKAWRPEMPAVRLWIAVTLVSLTPDAALLFGPLVGELIGLHSNQAITATVLIGFCAFFLSIYLLVWPIAWALGKSAFGPIQSIKIIHGSYWRTLGYYVAAFLPLSLVQDWLADVAMGRSPVVVWALMAIDSLIVCYLWLLIAGGMYIGAKRACDRKNVALDPEGVALPRANLAAQP